MSDMRVWVGCLACYNGGNLRGRWVEALTAGDITTEELHGGATTHEELWVFDIDDESGILRGECSPMEAARVAAVVADLTEDELGPFGAYMRNLGSPDFVDGPIVDDFREAYAGTFQTEEEFAEELAEDIGAIEQDLSWPCSCIDWSRAWNELRIGGDYWSGSVPEGFYIFRSI